MIIWKLAYNNTVSTSLLGMILFRLVCTIHYNEESRIRTCIGETYYCAHCLLFFQLAEQLYQTMSKRFNQSKKVWVGFGAFYMRQGKLDLGRKLLQRSLKSLPKRKRK